MLPFAATRKGYHRLASASALRALNEQVRQVTGTNGARNERSQEGRGGLPCAPLYQHVQQKWGRKRRRRPGAHEEVGVKRESELPVAPFSAEGMAAR